MAKTDRGGPFVLPPRGWTGIQGKGVLGEWYRQIGAGPSSCPLEDGLSSKRKVVLRVVACALDLAICTLSPFW